MAVQDPLSPSSQAGPRLGVGLDLPWGGTVGFRAGTRDTVSDGVARFLQRYSEVFHCFFASWQPKNRNELDPAEYYAAYDDLFSRIPASYRRTLHQTTLNLGALEPYDRKATIELTNALVDRYGLSWVNEDLGLWSLRGRPLPYPLPPVLTAEGLRAATRNVAEVKNALGAPLLVEFPGFSAEASLVIGRLHAYDFFSAVVREAGALATLDVGHLISYQWLRGKRGRALYDDLERLPTESCIEIHLSGSAIVEGRFMDFHHGVLLAEQLELLDVLVPLCPRLQVVTYEDPRFGDDGELLPETRESFERLVGAAEKWAA